MLSILQVAEQGGFEHDGVWITDIYYDETGRYEVDPREYYNINFKIN